LNLACTDVVVIRNNEATIPNVVDERRNCGNLDSHRRTAQLSGRSAVYETARLQEDLHDLKERLRLTTITSQYQLGMKQKCMKRAYLSVLAEKG
jgi:hypothetical protein